MCHRCGWGHWVCSAGVVLAAFPECLEANRRSIDGLGMGLCAGSKGSNLQPMRGVWVVAYTGGLADGLDACEEADLVKQTFPQGLNRLRKNSFGR